jgi:hypothetical protein
MEKEVILRIEKIQSEYLQNQIREVKDNAH